MKKTYYEFSAPLSLKVIFISDLHKAEVLPWSEEIFPEERPDLILFGGDMVSRTSTDFTNYELLCRAATGCCPVYACAGNHEQSLPDNYYAIYKSINEKYGIHYLENRTESLDIRGCKLNITGLTLPYGVYRNERGGFSGLLSYSLPEMREAVGEKREGFNILLAHNPIFLDVYSAWGADIVFSGHVHGGIVRLPLVGGLLSPERRFFPKYTKGIYSLGNTKMCLSAGIGKIRVFNPAETVIANLVRS
jgi:predicted MPP superfamily phosphohydrolase